MLNTACNDLRKALAINFFTQHAVSQRYMIFLGCSDTIVNNSEKTLTSFVQLLQRVMLL